MKTPKQEQFDDFLIDESDEYLLKMAEDLKQELSDINVNEDLIARTLAKVSEQAKDGATKAESNVVPISDIKAPVKHRRIYQWIKPLSVAVAACFLLFLGVNVAKNGLFLGSKKDASDNSAYEMNSSEARYEDNVLKRADVGVDGTQESATLANGEYGGTLVDPQTTSQKPSAVNESDNTVTEYTIGRETDVYSRALDAATSTANDAAKVYEFAQPSDDTKTMSLLTLLTSEELSVTTEEAIDEWTHYLVFSLGEEDAVTYQIGKSKFVVATSYHRGEEPSQVTYQIKNVDMFLESLTGYLK